MSDVEAILAFLTAATTLNFALLVQLWHRRGHHDSEPIELLFPTGFYLTSFAGTDRSGSSVQIAQGRTAYAMVFLTRGCPKCRTAAPLVEAAAAQIAKHKVELWVVTQEELAASDLSVSTSLEASFLDVPTGTYAMLNPRRASPAYLFIAPDMKVEASGFIGDEDWESFQSQLADAR